MKSKVELYQEYLDDAKEALVKLEIDERWAQRQYLGNERWAETLGNVQNTIKEQKPYIAFLEEILREEQAKESK